LQREIYLEVAFNFGRIFKISFEGEELSFDYNMQRQGLWSEVPSCHCGEINCTGILAADPATRRRWGK